MYEIKRFYFNYMNESLKSHWLLIFIDTEKVIVLKKEYILHKNASKTHKDQSNTLEKLLKNCNKRIF